MRQCRYCGAIYDNLDCPDCAEEHERGRGWHRGSWVGNKGRVCLTLDQIEGNAEEDFGGSAFAVKDFRQ